MAIQDLENGWRNEQLIGRIHFWKLFAVALLLTPILVLAASGLATAIGLSERWTLPLMGFLYGAGYYTLIRFLRQGRLRWFLRD